MVRESSTTLMEQSSTSANHLQVSAVVGKPEERAIAALRAASQLGIQTTDQEKLALMLMMETLIEQEELSDEVKEHVDELVSLTKGSSRPRKEIGPCVGFAESQCHEQGDDSRRSWATVAIWTEPSRPSPSLTSATRCAAILCMATTLALPAMTSTSGQLALRCSSATS